MVLTPPPLGNDVISGSPLIEHGFKHPPFMAVNIEESTEFKNGQAWYVLRLYGPLINGQKAVITITEIQVFFDIFVPEDLSPDSFKTKIRAILSGVIKWFKIEHVKVYLFRRYNPEKSHIFVFTQPILSKEKSQ
ncbi:unnamed protein product [Rhizophagus irregularis]|nr:unnamed protein product [Rhizophagus irregularis]